jgi:hypothetical protein
MYVAKLGGQIYRVQDACGGAVPAISVVGESLTAGEGGEVYWYGNDAIVPGETGTSFSPSQSGSYYAVVEMPNGCFRATQNVQWAVVSGIPHRCLKLQCNCSGRRWKLSVCEQLSCRYQQRQHRKLSRFALIPWGLRIRLSVNKRGRRIPTAHLNQITCDYSVLAIFPLQDLSPWTICKK